MGVGNRMKTQTEQRYGRVPIDMADLERYKDGMILHYSWGYDMTFNEFCMILEKVGKRLKCQPVRVEVKGSSHDIGGAKMFPTKEVIGEPFFITPTKTISRWDRKTYVRLPAKNDHSWGIETEERMALGYYENHND